MDIFYEFYHKRLTNNQRTKLKTKMYNSARKIFKSGDITKLTVDHLEKIFTLYDDIYFNTKLSNYIKDNNIILDFKVNNQLRELPANAG